VANAGAARDEAAGKMTKKQVAAGNSQRPRIK
jgi:hypothetical protein